MSFELRPSPHEAFAERLRSAEARKQKELSNPCRRPRATDMAAMLAAAPKPDAAK